MQAVTFQAPGEVRVEERPEPELLAPDDAIVRVEATGVCGSDLHIYHGRVKIEPGFTIGHEFVGDGDRGGRRASPRWPSATACSAASTPPAASCFFCRRGAVPQVRRGAGVRPRRDARLAPGRAGRAGARAARQPHAAARARGDVRRRRAVRRRRDGHRLPRGRQAACARATRVAVLGLGPGRASAPCRPRARRARRR